MRIKWTLTQHSSLLGNIFRVDCICQCVILFQSVYETKAKKKADERSQDSGYKQQWRKSSKTVESLTVQWT